MTRTSNVLSLRFIAILISVVMVVVLAVPAIQGDSVYAATEATYNNNKMEYSSNILLGKTYTVTAIGDRQNVTTGASGDERFIPSEWSGTIDGKSVSGTFSGPPYTLSFTPTQVGRHTVKIVFLLEKYSDTNGWEYSKAKKHTADASFDVVREVKKNPNKGKLLDCNGKIIGDSAYLRGDTYEYAVSYIPTRKGYEFTGWFTKKTGGSKVLATTKLPNKATTTIYAQWKKVVKVKVTFNANGGTVSKKSMTGSTSLAYGKLPVPKRSGYGLIGWYTAKKGGQKITDKSIVKNAKAHTLYARWGKSYKVTFDANKGSVSKKSKNVIQTTKYGTLPTPKRTNYQFLGWYTKKSGGTLVTADTKVNLSKNTTLYAHWQSGYTIELIADPGYCYPSEIYVKPGKKYGPLPTAYRNRLPSESSLTRYLFLGWYNSEGVKITDDSVFNGKSNQKLYARWMRTSVNLR